MEGPFVVQCLAHTWSMLYSKCIVILELYCRERITVLFAHPLGMGSEWMNAWIAYYMTVWSKLLWNGSIWYSQLNVICCINSAAPIGRYSSNLKLVNKDIYLQLFLWNCPYVNGTGTCWWLVNIGSGKDLLPSGNKPLCKPMLTKLHDAIIRPQRVKDYTYFRSPCYINVFPWRSHHWLR